MDHCPSGSTLLRRRPACATDFPVCLLCSVSLPLRFSLALPYSSSALVHTSSASVLWHPGSTSDACHSSFALVSEAICIIKSHLLSFCSWGSTTIGFVSIGRPPCVVSQVSTMSPPSVNSTVGYRQGCSLDLHLAASAPGSSLTPLSLSSTMDHRPSGSTLLRRCPACATDFPGRL
ncbi:hypothetical protein DPX16_22062 [Anabarilius grahami]|uniref:Uncharacterized protein n=1 Tax=Anabarilius grahami TaxID=495550 RepID=A0A3N0XND6_ANAGA|nr:hypothetical protein DPX16_22062 [Anabarilius grahami]